MLSKKEKTQYSKQIILREIGEIGQQALKKSNVLVVGAGGLGCPVLLQLTTSGIGTIGIIDNDFVALDNLPRQILYDYNSVNFLKVDQAVNKLATLNPNVNFIKYPKKLSSNNAIEIINRFDLIIDCSDNFPTRYLINDTCLLLNKPFIYGAIFKHEGQVAVLNYKSSATYRCLFPKVSNTTTNCSQSGVTPTLTNIIGSFQANEALKLIIGYGKLLTNKVLIVNSYTASTSIIEFKRKSNNNYSKINLQFIENDSNYNISCKNENNLTELSIAEFNTIIKNDVQLIDVREPMEKPIIDTLNAINIPISVLPKKTNLIEKHKKVVLFCNSGKRSKSAIALLQNNPYNFNNLASLKGGIVQWKNAIKQTSETK